MKADLTTKYDMLVPRYTSYPTAPHFNDDVTADVYGRWLCELDPKTPLSLYFHIPFCDEMCWFCGCYTKIVKRYEPVSEYLDTLLKEIDLTADHLPGRFSAHHLHWGGGSPTMLTGPDWMRIMDKLRARFDFAKNAEIAVEMDPRTATLEYVKAVASAGVNRASIGVQDFDPKVQEAINRIQPFEMTRQVVDWLRDNAIDGINMDLMYGLPHQTEDGVLDMIDKTVEIRPNRIALFGYAHVPWMKSHQKLIKEEDLPDNQQRWTQFSRASDRLEERGYVKIGLDHFALPDDALAIALKNHTVHRNFQGYTVDDSPAMLPFGASAIGALPQGYVQNVLPLRDYARAVEAGEFPVQRGRALTARDKLEADAIMRIMCDLECDLDRVCADHAMPPDALDAGLKKLAPMVADAIVAIDGRHIHLTAQGRPFVRLVASAFDAYLGSGQGRHSKAV